MLLLLFGHIATWCTCMMCALMMSRIPLFDHIIICTCAFKAVMVVTLNQSLSFALVHGAHVHNMCICVYAVCVCVFVCVHVYVYMYISKNDRYLCIPLYRLSRVFIHDARGKVCAHVCLYACMIWMYSSIHVCMYVCMRACNVCMWCVYVTPACVIRMHACICVYVCMYICLCTCLRSNVRMFSSCHQGTHIHGSMPFCRRILWVFLFTHNMEMDACLTTEVDTS